MGVASGNYEKYVSQQLQMLGARPWQIDQVGPLIAQALPETQPLITEVPESTSENEPEATPAL
jgi:hypothetical protein